MRYCSRFGRSGQFSQNVLSNILSLDFECAFYLFFSNSMKAKWLHVKTVRNFLADQLSLLRQYRHLYIRESGFSIPPDYANAVRVRVLMDAQNEVVGGFCFNTGQTAFRYVGFDPEKAHQALADRGLALSELSEITGIVFGPKIRRSQRQWLYARMAFDLLLSRKSVIMGGSFIPAIRRVQKQLMRHTLYTTTLPITRPDGQVQMMELEVYYAFRHEVLAVLSQFLLKDVYKHLRLSAKSVAAYRINRNEHSVQ